MTKQRVANRRQIKSLLYLIMTTAVATGLLGVVVTKAASPESDPPAWTSPQSMTIKRVSTVTAAQHEPVLLNNLNCNLVTYRQAATSSIQTGCFTETAFGLLDSDTDTVIFNGTDEGLPLLAYSAHEILAPWPGALDLVALDNASTGGSYISLYKNPLAVMREGRNILSQLIAKQLTAPPELPLKDPSGQHLVINPQSLAFSDNGSWLVAETLSGSFVRINLATLDITPFAPSYGANGNPALLKSRVAVSGNGRYVAIANDAAAAFKVYDLSTCTGAVSNLQPKNCQSYDYRAFAQTQVSGLSSIRHLNFVNDRLLSFEAVSNNPANGGIYELAPTSSIDSLIDYLGLGDSYTSGEGAYNYIPDTDSTNNMCHLSARSYPLLLTHDLFSSSGGHSVACSGAVIKDISSTNANYRGQVKDAPSFQQLQQDKPALLTSIMTNFVPGYVAQQRFVGQYQPRVVTVSVGGDDIGFGDIVLNCVMPHISHHLSDSTCYNTYEDRLELTKTIDRTVPRWTALYKQLLAASPGTRLYAIGYPRVASDKGDCALNAHLGKSELEFSEELIVYLNGAIKQAADKAGVTYVDISQALAGHRLCETASYNVAVNGLTAGTDGGVLGVLLFGKESYHPNAMGQALIEQTILKQTNNLTAVTSAVPDKTGVQDLIKGSKSGRIVQTVVPDNTIAAKVMKPSQTVSIKVSGVRDGLKANTTYIIRLNGLTGTGIAAVDSNDQGDISAGIVLPSATSPGGHTLDVTGNNQAGDPVDISQPVYVPASDNDSDGDGIVNGSDSCPTAINSGSDSDNDGIDDNCDGFIGPPPTAPPAAGSSSAPGGGQNPSGTPSTGNLTPTETTIAGVLTGDYSQFSVPTARLQPAVAPTIKKGSVLGIRTNSTPVIKQTLNKSPAARPAVKNSYSYIEQPPRLIRWLPWAILAGLSWLILLLLILFRYARGMTDRPLRTEYI